LGVIELSVPTNEWGPLTYRNEPTPEPSLVINIESPLERVLSVNPEIPAAPYAGTVPTFAKSLSFSEEDAQRTHSDSIVLGVFFPIISYASALIRDYPHLIRALYRNRMPSNDVETVYLGSLVKVCKGKQVNGELLSDEGHYYVMNGGITPSGYYNEFNTPPGTISISEGGNSCGYVQFNDNPFWSGGHCYTLLQPNTGAVNYKYLYHYLKSHQDDIMALRIGSGLPNIQKKDIEKYPVQLPRLEEQTQLAELFEAFCHIEKNEADYQDLLYKQKQFLLASVFT
jgi:type I restriction enzyme S subunit